MKNIYFVTTNKHKHQEAEAILKDYGISLVHRPDEYEENHDDNLEAIATKGALEVVERLGKPVVVEDTGLYFKAWAGFPGALPKFVFNTLGYKGIFRLLKNEDRGAFFKTVVAYCEPGSKPITFTAKMHGRISTQIFHKNKDVMPYDRVFIPSGKNVTISGMSLSEKNLLSQRGKAFRRFGKWWQEKEKG